jgi:hypothetical protein
MTADDFERSHGVLAGARAGLGAIVAIGAAARDDTAGAKAAARAGVVETESYGWLSLTPAEQAEIYACLAIGLQHAGEGDVARKQLEQAIAPALKLARSGELAPFGRLCQVLFELLPTDRATLIWAEWLIAAAGAGANEAIGLIAACVRWLPEADLARVAVSPLTGQLHSRAN